MKNLTSIAILIIILLVVLKYLCFFENESDNEAATISLLSRENFENFNENFDINQELSKTIDDLKNEIKKEDNEQFKIGKELRRNDNNSLLKKGKNIRNTPLNNETENENMNFGKGNKDVKMEGVQMNNNNNKKEKDDNDIEKANNAKNCLKKLNVTVPTKRVCKRWVDVPDIKKFTAKSSAPDLTKYVLKSKIPTCPDMRKYILKNQIPKCKAMPDMTKYILKSKIPACEKVDMTKYMKKEGCKKCPPNKCGVKKPRPRQKIIEVVPEKNKSTKNMKKMGKLNKLIPRQQVRSIKDKDKNKKETFKSNDNMERSKIIPENILPSQSNPDLKVAEVNLNKNNNLPPKKCNIYKRVIKNANVYGPY